MQMDVHKTLYSYYTSKGMPHVTATVAKKCSSSSSATMLLFTHTFFSHRIKMRGYYQQSLSRCITCHRWLFSTVTCGKAPTAFPNLKWTFEDLLPCYCYETKTNSAEKSAPSFAYCLCWQKQGSLLPDGVPNLQILPKTLFSKMFGNIFFAKLFDAKN